MKKLNIIIEAPLLQKDFKRFGISYLSKNFQIVIIDISYLTKKKIYQDLFDKEKTLTNKLKNLEHKISLVKNMIME